MPNLSSLQLHSLVTKSGELQLSLARAEMAEPAADEVLVRVDATPINPSDLGLLIGPADMKSARVSGKGEQTTVSGPVAPQFMRMMTPRLDKPMQVGNEGAGIVIKSGSSPQAASLMGKTVAVLGGAMYQQYRIAKAADVLVLHAGTTAVEGASCFVNPLTALGMVETMRLEKHKALVHTAAASNLGQMLNRICLKDGVSLVNIVRSADQEKLLRGIGAKIVVNSQSPTYMEDLTRALAETGATIAFDATGGGKLANQILAGMEAAANLTATGYSRYGSTTHKQVYIYGGLDTGPTELTRSYGMAWGVGGWLLTPFLMKIGPAEIQKLRQRVADEIKTTFASHYTRTISLVEALQPDIINAYNKRATGEKFLINPNKDL